jgi:hypothetical protein
MVIRNLLNTCRLPIYTNTMLPNLKKFPLSLYSRLPWINLVQYTWNLTPLPTENSLHLKTKGVKNNIMLKMTVFWDVAPCSLVETDRRFRGVYRLHHQGDKHLWKVGPFLLDWSNIPEDSHLHTRHRENLKSHNIMILKNLIGLFIITSINCVANGIQFHYDYNNHMQIHSNN